MYAIFISPLFDIETLTCYADDKFPVVFGKDRAVLAARMKAKLEAILLWLTKSGMVVNESKTGLCVFYKHDCTPLVIELNGKFLISQSTINVLGVIFDSKLQWAPQVSHCVTKSLNALNAIKLIKRFFKRDELLQLVTSNFYSILYYNSEIWHLPNLNNSLKSKLISASARALKVCMYYPDPMMSFERIHAINKRATPNAIMNYNLGIQLYKLYNTREHSLEWLHLNQNQILTSRQTRFQILRSNSLRIGLNALANRLANINGKIELTWLNLSYESFKIKCKRLFIQN